MASNTYDLLEQEFGRMKWRRTRRRNVSGEMVESMPFGFVFRPFEGYKTGSNNADYPLVYELLQRLSSELHFPCNAYTINKNVECKPHVDRRNDGDSLIVALGNFKGGEFVCGKTEHDIRRMPLRFNGSKIEHSTRQFSGIRYSIVMYTITPKGAKQ